MSPVKILPVICTLPPSFAPWLILIIPPSLPVVSISPLIIKLPLLCILICVSVFTLSVSSLYFCVHILPLILIFSTALSSVPIFTLPPLIAYTLPVTSTSSASISILPSFCIACKAFVSLSIINL